MSLAETVERYREFNDKIASYYEGDDMRCPHVNRQRVVSGQVAEWCPECGGIFDGQSWRAPKKSGSMSIEQIGERVRAAGLNVGKFWDEAMGGDRAPQPRKVVDRIIAKLKRTKARA